MPVMLKRLVYTGSTLRSRPETFKTRVAQELLEKVWPLLAEGTVGTHTHKVFPFEEATAAHEMMESAQHRGKILLRP